ncbi:MAG TPA: ABC transporter permease, partial [Puia sp.]|nr:ABC transporter permease [Puia sp.]
MFRHLFTLIWNKKKQNALLITEIFISFLVIFAVFTLIVYDVRNYLKPLGFDYSDVWVINYDNTLATNNGDSLANFYGSLKKTLLSMPEIRYVSYTADNFPYSQSTNSTGVKYSGSECQSDIYTVEESYKDLFNIPLMEGRWFGPADQTFAYRPIVINEALKENLFHDIEPVGKQIGFSYDEKTKYKVVGVVNSVKAKGDYTIADPAYYILADTGSYRNFLNRILLKVTPGADAAFEGRLYKTVANALANANIEIEHLANKRTSSNYFSLVPMIISLIVAGFLIINVALGLFGVLWYNINKRKGEIGL